jgi:integrase
MTTTNFSAPAQTPTLAQYLTRWLADIVEPNLEPATYAYYETMARLYIVPALGSKHLDQLQISDVETWLNQLAQTCQCCARRKDATRPETQQRCCAIGACCADHASRRTIQAARNTLRAALNHAKTSDGLLPRNVAAFALAPTPPKRRQKGAVWSVEEASRFLTSARDENDPLYAAYVLVLVNALSKGEVLGLTWSSVDPETAELDSAWQLQRVRRQLIHKNRGTTKHTDTTLPMPTICSAALELRREEQTVTREQADRRWQASDLVFTTRWGTPVEPRNFNRSFDARCIKAGVPRIRVHDTRHVTASLLAALDVRPGVAMRILRHAQVTTTIDAYTDIPGAMTTAALNRLADSPSGLPPVEGELR